MEPQPDIYIIGAGAIGKVLAVILQSTGRNVTLIRGSVNDLVPYTETITVELADGAHISRTITISTINKFQTLDGIILLTNKSFGNATLATQLKYKTGNSPLVFLQNGLSIEQPFIAAGFPELYRCVLFATSQPSKANSYRFRPVNPSPIGIIRGTVETLQALLSTLNNDHFPFTFESNIQPTIWKKAIINSVFNSVCPLLETDNGIFHRNEKAREIAGIIVSECMTVAIKNRIELTHEAVMESLLVISKASDGQLISTYQDIRNGRRTEIDTLNMAIAALDDDKITPVTKLLGEMILLKAAINLRSN
jgi:2-dehydropantoate 2-reductase